ncbi:hypothetical protein EV702DRAFT_1077652 [Suillus placidus]|uniref:Uncharacterized protein n=1 Tax=Suillus placidus TaxID=48579 RepID=A0A9P7A2Y8_9AGAM|nr:hypothetical protein EV702DRAFT_1077652 [Suillus placidus]
MKPTSYFPLARQPSLSMSFHSSPSSIRGSSYDSDEPSRCMTVDTPEPAPASDMMTGRAHSRHVSRTKRPRSPSSDKTDSDINEPVTAPPIIHHLSRFVKHAKSNPKPYKRDGSTTSERRFFNNQLRHNGSMSQTNAQRSKDVLQRRLRQLSSEAAAQAVVTMHADVEWRHVCALATAWEIYASEEHLKFLHMVLEDEGERYASAAREPLGTSIQELATSHEEDLKERIDSGVAAYSRDVTSFAVGDTQLDCLENLQTRMVTLTTLALLSQIRKKTDSVRQSEEPPSWVVAPMTTEMRPIVWAGASRFYFCDGTKFSL